MTPDLFSGLNDQPTMEAFDEGVVVLRRHAVKHQQALMRDIEQVARQAPFRHMKTPGGHQMSAAMTCCGPLGWVTDETGDRYQPQDPLSGLPWPAMPESLPKPLRRSPVCITVVTISSSRVRAQPMRLKCRAWASRRASAESFRLNFLR